MLKKSFTKVLGVLLIATILFNFVPASKGFAANAPRTAITYNQNGQVWWDGGGSMCTDFNGDGILDVTSGVNKYTNTGTNLAPILPKYESGTSINIPWDGVGTLLDFDSDGDQDFIYRKEARLYKNTGTN